MMMKRLALALTLLAINCTALAQELATCRNPQGHAYYPQLGIVDAKRSGWKNDKISDGVFTLRRIDGDDYDILYVDATKAVHSTKGEGGSVKLLRYGENEMTFILFYPDSTVEVYTFLRDNSGMDRLSILTTKGGDSLVPYKQSLMVTNCSRVTYFKPTAQGN